jgi:hypothetical protein
MNATQFSLGYPKSLTKRETDRQKSNTVVPPNSRNFQFADFLIRGFFFRFLLSRLIRGFPNSRFFLEPINRELGGTTVQGGEKVRYQY